MPALLPALVFALVILLLHRRMPFLQAALVAACFLGGFVVVTTELLAYFTSVTRVGVVTVWFSALILAFVAWLTVPHLQREPFVAAPWTLEERLLFSGCGLICLGVILVATFAPPNTGDVMAYHMPRVVMWAQHRSLAFYQTGDLQQLFMPPFAEFAMLHLYLLADGDRFVSYVQAFAFVGCVLNSALLAQLVGLCRRLSFWSALACATVPQIVLQASGSKNDLVAAFWLSSALVACLLFGQTRAKLWLTTTSVCIALAVLTKGTMYLLVPPCIAAVVFGSWPFDRRMLAAGAFTSILAVAALSGPHAGRNWIVFGSPLGSRSADSAGRYPFRPDEISVGGAVANVVRNASVHLASDVKGLNGFITRLVRRAVRMLGRDPDDPAWLWPATQFYLLPMPWNEVGASNPLHFALIATASVWCALRWRLNALLAWYTAGVVVAFVVFSCLLRWQPWHTRLHAPLFVCGACIIAGLVGNWKRPASSLLGSLLFIHAAFALSNNQLRPLATTNSVLLRGRAEQYFSDRPTLAPAVYGAAEFISARQCRDVALDVSHLSFSYGVMAAVQRRQPEVRFYYTGREWPTPACAVVCLECRKHSRTLPYSEYPVTVVFGNTLVSAKAIQKDR